MTALNAIILFAITYLVVFAEGYFTGLRAILGAQFDVLPALMVYCGLSTNLGILTAEAILAGCLFDSLSANPMGITIAPLFLVGFIIHQQRELILRDEAYAQFVLGTGASLIAPLLTALLLLVGGHEPLIGWGSAWQIGVMALLGGLFTPVCFWVLDRIYRMLNYQSVPETTFRPDREIKRGRGHA
jgi:rod shape-determining protein MreD